jgi:hypothetical protein
MNTPFSMKFLRDCTVALATRWSPAFAILVAFAVNPPVAPAQFLSLPNSSKNLPNTGQQLTPMAVPGGGFQPLNPGLPDNPGWLVRL